MVEVFLSFVHGEETAGGIPVNNGYGPDVAGLFHAAYEVADEVTLVIGKVFRGLPVFFIGIDTCAVDRRQQYDLFLGQRAF